jgi:organic hydroperoxide reductase OsmC/OhrA
MQPAPDGARMAGWRGYATRGRRRRHATQPGEGITKIALTVRGTVPGIDEEGFREAAEGAKDGCPVSGALTGVPEITVDAV